MNSSPEEHEAPPELADALARMEQAKEDYISLVREMDKFLYRYVKGMVKGLDRDSGNFVLKLRHPKESIVTGRPKVLVAQIVEHLRTALDYMIFELSVLNEPNLDERVPQFVIADSESEFESRAKNWLRYLTDEQKSFVEQIQPYHENGMLSLLGKMGRCPNLRFFAQQKQWLTVQNRTAPKMAGRGKHRRLLSIRDNTGFDIYFAEMTKKDQFKDCFVYPVEEGHAIFARPKGKGVVVLMEKYDAMSLLKDMIEHTADIVRVSFCFFQGRPLNLTIVPA